MMRIAIVYTNEKGEHIESSECESWEEFHKKISKLEREIKILDRQSNK